MKCYLGLTVRIPQNKFINFFVSILIIYYAWCMDYLFVCFPFICLFIVLLDEKDNFKLIISVKILFTNVKVFIKKKINAYTNKLTRSFLKKIFFY